MTAYLAEASGSRTPALTLTRGSYGAMPSASSGHLPCSQQAVVPSGLHHPVRWVTRRSFFRTSLLCEEDLAIGDVAHGSGHAALALARRRCRAIAYPSSAVPCFTYMLLSPRPFGSRSVVRLGVICPERRPPLVAIPAVRDMAHRFPAPGSSGLRLLSRVPPGLVLCSFPPAPRAMRPPT